VSVAALSTASDREALGVLLHAGATGTETGTRREIPLEDPAGLVLCVVSVQTGERFEAGAVTWD
jgi:hypothetical protein